LRPNQMPRLNQRQGCRQHCLFFLASSHDEWAVANAIEQDLPGRNPLLCVMQGVCLGQEICQVFRDNLVQDFRHCRKDGHWSVQRRILVRLAFAFVDGHHNCLLEGRRDLGRGEGHVHQVSKGGREDLGAKIQDADRYPVCSCGSRVVERLDSFCNSPSIGVFEQKTFFWGPCGRATSILMGFLNFWDFCHQLFNFFP
jgi:hypothetical protein